MIYRITVDYPDGCLKCTVLDEQCTEAETENRPQFWG